MNISESLQNVIADIAAGRPFAGALSKDDLQRATFVSLSQIFKQLETLQNRIKVLEDAKPADDGGRERKKWKQQD